MLVLDSVLEKGPIHSATEVDFSSPKVCLKTDTLSSRYPNLLNVFVIQMVASAMEVDAGEITRQPRGNTKLCRARQVAMYLMNVALGISFNEIGKVFGKDRTTVSYACGVIEELRDVPVFDDRLIELEDILSTVLQMLPSNFKANA